MSKRKAIRKDDYLAAALACLLPQEQRDAMRAAKVPAQDVIRLFSPDHIGLHCFEEPNRDCWFNITPTLRPEHREKSRRDTSIAAKVKRIRVANGMVGPDDLIEAADRQMARPLRGKAAGALFKVGGGYSRTKNKIAQRVNNWPPKGSRPFRSFNRGGIHEP